MEMDFMSMILDQGLIVIPCLYIIGVILKGLEFIPDKYIPLILLPIGILATCSLSDGFTANNVIQGVLVTGAAVYVNNLVKQIPKTETKN